MAKALTEEEKIRRLKLRMLKKKMNALMELAQESVMCKDTQVTCPVCHRCITEEDIDTVEYVKTKRHSEIFVHTECVSKWNKW